MRKLCCNKQIWVTSQASYIIGSNPERITFKRHEDIVIGLVYYERVISLYCYKKYLGNSGENVENKQVSKLHVKVFVFFSIRYTDSGPKIALVKM